MYNTGVNGAATTGPRAKCDQVVFEALCKACEVIVGSRTNSDNRNTGTDSTNGTGSTPSTSLTSSSRFNLQIPEVAGVRSILSQLRLQLYVPVRLDVFFQHPDGSRELIERWCLEYKTVASERFLQVEGVVTNDPMVQLTQVCKRVVLWLRTLYCWTRLLPAHTLGTTNSTRPQHIGFSIYALPDYSDDLAELTNQQGFVMSSQHGVGVVTTPYGELTWRVVHCSPSKLEQLVPNETAVARGLTSHSHPVRPTSQPIPMKPTTEHARNRLQQQQLLQQQQHQQAFAPRSAPAQRPPTYTERSQQKRLEAEQHQQLHQHQQQAIRHRGTSHEPVRSIHRTVTAKEPKSQQQHHPTSIARSHSTSESPRRIPILPSTSNPPERVLSGLSLALMMTSIDDDKPICNTTQQDAASDDSSDVKRHSIRHNDVTIEHEREETEKTRRAALHELPPHLMEQQMSSAHTAVAATSADYGYGYNNHIPWQTIHPSTSNPSLVPQHLPTSNSFGRTLSTSPGSSTFVPHGTLSPQHLPHSIPQTPPGAVFLGATPPLDRGGLGQMIPPRNRSDSKSITPPFQPRPAGFLHGPPTLYLEPPQQHQGSTLGELDSRVSSKTTVKTPVSSLDALRSSPFQQQNVLSLHTESRSFMVSSLSFTPTLGSSNTVTHPGNVDLHRSLWGGASGALLPSSLAGSAGIQQHPLFQQNEDYYSEEMPFAVELSSSTPQGLVNNGSSSKQMNVSTSKTSSSSYLGSSTALASLAQKCAVPAHRLKLLERNTVDAAADTNHGPLDAQGRPESSLVSSLADQLNEFRSFGASLHVSPAVDASHVVEDQLHLSASSSTSTPISLRT